MITKVFKFLWSGIDATRRFMLNLFFLLIMAAFFVLLLPSNDKGIANGTVLVLAPFGEVVEQLDPIDPAQEFLSNVLSNTHRTQTLLRNMVKVLEHAKQDSRIPALVIDTSNMSHIGASQLHELGQALTDFKSSGKKIYAYGDTFLRSQYYLAAHADTLEMHPLGGIYIDGYGVLGNYFKDSLDKLGVNVYVFRVGTYKSAVEPYLRNDMSPDAKEATKAWLTDLWAQYQQKVTELRTLAPDALDNYIDSMLHNLRQNDNNIALTAKAIGLVDQLASRGSWRNGLIERFGADESDQSTFKQINHEVYLNAIKQEQSKTQLKPGTAKVGVIVAKGDIHYRSNIPGQIDSESLANLFRQARLDEDIKAIVLRIDSPGGSAFGSEVIRLELAATQQSGIPVIASFGSVAASGGYWIASTANQIFAAPTTVTGSIGVFGVVPTFAKPLDKIGLHFDGVGTHAKTWALRLDKDLDTESQQMMQLMINKTYQQFIALVAEGRGMSTEAVERVAQGRVWSGEQAFALGLVDHLGNLDQAIQAAADEANIGNQFETIFIEKPLSTADKMLRQLFGQSSQTLLTRWLKQDTHKLAKSPIDRMLSQTISAFNQLKNLNDPQHAYAHCNCTPQRF